MISVADRLFSSWYILLLTKNSGCLKPGRGTRARIHRYLAYGRRDIFYLYSRQYRLAEIIEKKQKILLSNAAFYQRFRHDLPNEAERGGTRQYLRPFSCRTPDPVNHSLFV